MELTEFEQAVERGTKGLTAVSTGICPGCDQCKAEYAVKITCEECSGETCEHCDWDGDRLPTDDEFREQWSTEQILSEPSFTWSGCDICGNRLGLDADIWHAIDTESGDIIHGEHCCQDCACYLANGDHPEDWGK